jgi:hypothetical protein
MDYRQMTAPCGLACFDCVVHKAKDDPALREMLAGRMQRPAAEVGCDGCRAVGGKCPIVPGECPIYACVREKGVAFCGDCADFPCDHLHPYADGANSLPHNMKVFNLCLIRKMGVEAWAQQKARKTSATYFQEKWRL